MVQPNNVKTLHNDFNVLCFGDESNAQFGRELCQYVLEDVDVLANSIIGESVSCPIPQTL